MDMPLVTYVEPEVVLRVWLNPPPACHAPAPRSKPIHVPESWTVVSTATGNPWTGDVPLLANGSYTCELTQLIRLTAGTRAFPAPRV